MNRLGRNGRSAGRVTRRDERILRRSGQRSYKSRRVKAQLYYVLAMVTAFLMISILLIVKNSEGLGFSGRDVEEHPLSQGVGSVLELLEQKGAAWDDGETLNWNHRLAGEYSLDISKYGLEEDKLPAWQGEPYIELAAKPVFPDDLRTESGFESYAKLDWLGRCGCALANIGTEMMPTKQREDISSVHPSGWQTIQYDFIEGENLYNRCHLIGFLLTGENANEYNLITGTRYMNVEGMFPFEMDVANYVRETQNHVLYRVTPVYYKNELVARGVIMEAESIEDHGSGISFCVYVFNNQPDVEIDYRTGQSRKVADL